MIDYLKPFSLMAQLNNIGMFIFAYIALDQYQKSQCKDIPHQHFLYWIIYGAVGIYSLILLLTGLNFLGLLDVIVRRLNCGAVCVTLQALGILVFAAGFHIISLIYGLLIYYSLAQSHCKSLNIFTRVTGLIYSIWVVIGVFYTLQYWYMRPEQTNYVRV